jgi:ABC-type dipeptide/oligopeptide/nickel transport system permease component
VAAYVVRRTLHAVGVVVAVSMLIFGLLHLGGDPTSSLLPLEATAADVARTREQFGLDRPLPEQYLRFVARALQGDFGVSFRHRQDAMSIVLERTPATLILATAALGVSLLIAVPAGVVGAVKRGSWSDRLAMLVAAFGQSMPSFWLGLMLILVVAVNLRWLPASGAGDWRYLVLPAITLGMPMAAITARLLRSSLLEVLSKDYVRTARSKGLAEWAVLSRHAARNAAIPVLTILGLQVGGLLSGAIITETVFGYPGMGLLTVQAISGRDFPVVRAFVLGFTTLIVMLNLIVDLLYARIDPRIRYS